jgi:hypothetical protein
VGGYCEERKRRSNPDGSGKDRLDCFTSVRYDDKRSNGASNASEALVTVYREGLGLAAVVLVAGEIGARLIWSAEERMIDAGEAVHARWWCKSAQQAEWLAEAAVRAAQRSHADAARRLDQAVLNAAKRLGITLRSDEEVAREALAAVARLDQEIAAQQRAGGLKSVNRGYRDYRLAASARGEKVLRYAQWMERYKAKLVRDIAHNLRSR